MRYNFIVTILILISVFGYASYYIIFNLDPGVYSFTAFLVCLWIFLLLTLTSIFFVINFATSTIAFKIKTATSRNTDREKRVLSLMDRGVVKLNLSKEIFRKQINKSLIIASIVIIFLILQKLIGIL